MDVKKGIIGGLAAGVMAGIVAWIVGMLLTLAGLWGITEPIPSELFPSTTYLLMGSIVLGVIFGVVFGIIYAMLYPSILGKDLSKGLCYGFLIWIIKDIAAAAYMFAGWQAGFMALDFLVVGLPMWLVYGAVLATVYEKLP
jgi:hypothetical protein